MKILIIGHRQSGKTDIGHRLAQRLNTIAHDSSWYAAENIIYPVLKHSYGYESVKECFNDRGNCRDEWFNLIREYNDEPDRLTRDILSDGDIYVGMRSRDEFEGSKHHFDVIVWVDADGRVPEEAKTSMELTESDATHVLNNRGPIEKLDEEIRSLVESFVLDGYFEEV